jgi:hypothetical protein
VAVLVTSSGIEAVAAAADSLVQRKIKPVVILIDSTSFGGSAGVEHLGILLQKKKIPVSIVRKGDEIKWDLEKGFLG